MGYFSQLAITMEARAARERERAPEPRERLLDRIRDLTDRLDDFRKTPDQGPYATYEIFPDRSLQHPILRYVLPENLQSRDEVRSALMLAESDLREMDQNAISSVAFLIPGQTMIRAAVNW